MQPSLRLFLLGAAPGVGQRAAHSITTIWPWVQVVGVHSPPIGFEQHAAENRTILDLLRTTKPDLLVVGLGAPKQELWVHAHRDEIDASVALCVERPSTSWPVRSNERPGGCDDWAWNGAIAWRVIRAVSFAGMPTTPGCSRNWSGKSCADNTRRSLSRPTSNSIGLGRWLAD
jgi:hypothetical protein